jgi:hypothetical protein
MLSPFKHVLKAERALAFFKTSECIEEPASSKDKVLQAQIEQARKKGSRVERRDGKQVKLIIGQTAVHRTCPAYATADHAARPLTLTFEVGLLSLADLLWLLES